MSILQELLTEGKKFERMAGELTDKEKQVIAAIKKPEDIKTIKVNSEWTDDHLPCVGATINGVPMGFWWLSRQGAGAFDYPESDKARKMVVTMIKTQIEIAKEDGEWM